MLSKITNKLSKKVERGDLLHLEAELMAHPDVKLGDNDMCPVEHSFSDGIYVREIFIPAGVVLTGKVHKHDHPNFLMQGIVDVATEFNGVQRLEAPMSMISLAGTKRAVHAITDTIWITVHKNESNTQDLNELEKNIIAKDYEEYDYSTNK